MWADCLENVGASTSHYPMVLDGLFPSFLVYRPYRLVLWIHVKRGFYCVAYVSCFEKMKVGLCDLHAVCLCSPPPSTFEWLNQSSWNLACTVMAPVPILTSYFINPSRQFVSVSLQSLLSNGWVEIPLTLVGNGSVRTLPRQRIHRKQYKNCWTRPFLCDPWLMKESMWLVLPRTSCFICFSF
jgi:hypothetical protein